VFRAQVVKPGRTLTVCETRAFALDKGEERIIATMTGTLTALFEREGQPVAVGACIVIAGGIAILVGTRN
jgi:biotin carboxyl carrier protein